MQFCAACGAPVASDTFAAMGVEMRRNRIAIRLIAAALGLIFVLGAGLAVSRWMPTQRQSPPAAMADRQAPSASQPEVTPPAGAGSSNPTASQPVRTDDAMVPPAQQALPSVPSAPSAPSIDLPLSAGKTTANIPRHSQQTGPEAPGGISAGTDRYPGSQPIKVDAELPDIGVPVDTAAYTTSDSLSEVLNYYRQRYPDAQMTEMNGQKVFAVDRPGRTEVIAVGTNGAETRIAIVQAK